MKERGLRSRWTDKVIVLPEGTEDLWSSEYLELVQLADRAICAIFGTTRSGKSFRKSW